MDAKQLDLDGVEVGTLYRVTIKARRPMEDKRPEGDPAIKAGYVETSALTYAMRAPTWRAAIDEAMDLYPKTDEDGTKYTITVEES